MADLTAADVWLNMRIAARHSLLGVNRARIPTSTELDAIIRGALVELLGPCDHDGDCEPPICPGFDVPHGHSRRLDDVNWSVTR